MYKKKNPAVLIIGCILIGSAIFTIVEKKSTNDVPVYSQPDHIETQNEKKEKELDIEMEIKTNEEEGYSISIPKDWEMVIKDGFETYIHPASGSSVQVQVLPYDPMVNQQSAELISTEVSGTGKTFVNFTRKDTSSYEVLYQDFKNSTYDYVEEVYWDRSKIIKLVCITADQNYERILPYFDKIIHSFAWKKESPIPEDFGIVYNEAGGYEIGVSVTWNVNQSETTFMAQDPQSGATLSVVMQEKPMFLDKMTATDMSNLIRPGKNNFMMQNFDTSKERATAKATYLVNNVQINNLSTIFADGTNLYFVSADYESGTITEETMTQAVELFRQITKDGENVEEEECYAGTDYR